MRRFLQRKKFSFIIQWLNNSKPSNDAIQNESTEKENDSPSRSFLRAAMIENVVLIAFLVLTINQVCLIIEHNDEMIIDEHYIMKDARKRILIGDFLFE